MSTSPGTPRLAQIISTAVQGRRHWQVLFVMLLIAVCLLAFTPRPPKQFDSGWDKLNHALAFAALTLSAWLGYVATNRNIAVLLMSLFALGGWIELVQLLVPGRSCEWQDLLADTVGMAVGALVATLLRRLAGRSAR